MRLTQIRRFPERLLSTVQRGTAFEYRALALLTKHMSMSLTRVGGSYDGGVDLIGWWWVPSENHTTRACRVLLLGAPLSSKPLPRPSRRHLRAHGLHHNEAAPTARHRAVQSRKEEDGPRIPARARGRRIPTRRRRLRHVLPAPGVRARARVRVVLSPHSTSPRHHHRRRPNPHDDVHLHHNNGHSTPSAGTRTHTRTTARRAPRFRIRLYAQLPPHRARLASPVPSRAPALSEQQQRQWCCRHGLWQSGARIRKGRARRGTRNPLGAWRRRTVVVVVGGTRWRSPQIMVAGTATAELDA